LGEPLPVLYTCDGQNISPPLSWTGTPENTKSLALFFDDITSPYGNWCHWVLYNISAEYRVLRENVPPERMLSWKGVQGRNDYDRIGYAGPCPPEGEERQYVFRLFALDVELDVEPRITRLLLLKHMRGSIIDRAELACTYSRNESDK
jgi:Raf kinase inhibitor-like YbhB/YbcL family protein